MQRQPDVTNIWLEDVYQYQTYLFVYNLFEWL